jgi:hypothetical protein
MRIGVMFQIQRRSVWLVASLATCLVVALSSFAAPPPGKGGGGNQPPALPTDLNVRYRVQFIPLPTDARSYAVHDLNEVYEAVGAYNDVDGFRVGYYYDALNSKLLTANEMITLPEQWVNTSFVGINNYGAIVGMVQDSSGFHQCILVLPGFDGTYSYEITSPVDAFGDVDSHFTKINDSGDIVGISWDSDGVGSAFAYNPGIFPPVASEPFRDFTFFGSPGARWNSMQVKNARLGMVRVGAEMSWFDFFDGQEFPAQLPANERTPSSDGLSNDGQYTVNEAVFEKKGKSGSYRYTPGIMVAGQYVWQGNPDDGYATLVNSAVGANLVGDVVGFNEVSRVRWLRHADHPEWGYLDLSAMVVFSSAEDEALWSLIPEPGARVWGMSDRDPATGFGVLLGHHSAFSVHAAYLLIPEIFPKP